MLPHNVFHETAGKLVEEFYPDFRQCISDIAKDISNKVPDNEELDGILSAVMITCMCKDMALILAPYPEEHVHDMISTIMFTILASLPAMRQELKLFLERENNGTN